MKGVLFLGVTLVAVCTEARSAHEPFRFGREPRPSGCPPVDPLPNTVHLPHPWDCSMFLRCDHGLAKPERCPANLHFNPALQVCDWPERAGCVAGVGPDGFDREWADTDNESEKMQGDQPQTSDTSNFLPEDWLISNEETNPPQSEKVDTIKDEDIFYTDPE